MPCNNADRQLGARDLELPGLTTLLDDGAMLALLQGAGQPVQAVRGVYLRYKPYTSCLVAYNVLSQGQTYWVHGKVFSPQRTEKLTKYQRLGDRPIASGLSPLVRCDLGLAIAPFPLDRSLKALRQLVEPPTQSEVLQALFPKACLGDINLETLNYKPERRYVAQARQRTATSPSWVIKAYTQADYATAHRNSGAVKPQRVLQVAPLAGCSPDHHMLVFAWVSGQPLPDLMRQAPRATVKSTLEQVGIALAELHDQPLDPLGLTSCTDEVLDLMGLVSDLCYLQPSLAGRLKPLSRTIADGLVQLPQHWCSTHGDFKPDQVLMQGDRVTLLDFDRAARAHPARDLGSFLAQLDYQHIQGDLDDSRRRAAATALLNGYTSHSEAPAPDALRLYTALSLFKLLPEPFRYRAPDWPTRMEKLLHRIEETLQPSAFLCS